jgi:NADPH:quinone reductase-like Zn-dependent oxidoreductase
VLELRDIDKPVAGPGQVLVRVHAAGVDRGVWHFMTGRPYLFRLAGIGLRRPKAPMLGIDVAGRVEAVGPGVTRFGPGDEIMGVGTATFAEYAIVPEDKAVVRPARLSAEHAAAVPVSAITALQALRDQARVRPGQRVLVIGASGGVGTYAVQLAKAFGAEVTGVCSPAKVELVRSLGADHVLDYTRGELGGGPYEVILDIGGNRPLRRLRRLLTPTGTLVIVGGEGGDRWTGGLHRQLAGIVTSPFAKRKVRVFVAREGRADLEALSELIEAGTVTPAIDRTYPLADTPAAIERMIAGRARGKIVVTV